jgi:hypothetical protein
MHIAHISLGVAEPRHAADTLAAIMGGEALPFPPAGPDGWVAWSADGRVSLEIGPANMELAYGETEVDMRVATARQPRFNACHAAICVDRPAEEILELARSAGWPARVCSRGDLFHVAEVWVDGTFLIEFLDPAFTREYVTNITPAKWKTMLATMAES